MQFVCGALGRSPIARLRFFSAMARSARSGSASSGPNSGAEVPAARAIKAKLLAALGDGASDYWATLVAFCRAQLDRREFEAAVSRWITPELTALHNAFVLSILAEVSTAATGGEHRMRGRHGAHAPTSPIRAPQSTFYDPDESDEWEDPPVDGSARAGRKRLRHLFAGLSQRERKRLQLLPRSGTSAVATGSAGWAGAGAELLEKKRKEDEKRKSIEEKRRTREAKSAIGAVSWQSMALQAASQAENLRPRLSSAAQEAFARGVLAPLCVEDHSLPDVYGIQDRMTLTAVEAGLPGGVHIQAAAVVLSALQDHLRNIISATLAKVRSQRKKSALPASGAEAGEQASLRMSVPDMSLVFDLAPHSVVEPLGQSTMERLLVPDEALTGPRTSIDGAGNNWEVEDAIASIARQCATTKLATAIGAAPDTAALPADEEKAGSPEEHPKRQLLKRQQQHRDSVRNQVLLDQLAPLRLLDRRALAEVLASEQTEAGKSVIAETPISKALAQHYHVAHHHTHANPNHRHKDEFWDVVDPVALMGRLCE